MARCLLAALFQRRTRYLATGTRLVAWMTGGQQWKSPAQSTKNAIVAFTFIFALVGAFVALLFNIRLMPFSHCGLRPNYRSNFCVIYIACTIDLSSIMLCSQVTLLLQRAEGQYSNNIIASLNCTCVFRKRYVDAVHVVYYLSPTVDKLNDIETQI